ncbi:transposase, partial [Neisseria meningitidis]
MQKFYVIDFLSLKSIFLNKFALKYSGLNLNQDKATKPQTVQIVRQGEATPYWFKF